MLSRPPSSPAIAILKPTPSGPTRLAAGTRTPSMITWRVGWARHPIFFSLAPKLRPGASFSMRKADIAPGSPLARARHDEIEVAGAGAGNELLDAVEHIIAAVGLARVVSAAASEPAPGSVRQ